jgi:hypothetical protein
MMIAVTTTVNLLLLEKTKIYRYACTKPSIYPMTMFMRIV